MKKTLEIFEAANRTDLAFSSTKKLMKDVCQAANFHAKKMQESLQALSRLQDDLGRISAQFREESDDAASKEIANDQNELARNKHDLRNRMNDCLGAFENSALMSRSRIKYVK